MSKVNMTKAEKVLGKTFLSSIKDLSEDELTELVVKSELKLKAIKDEMENDEKLQAAKSLIKDLAGSYTAARNYEDAKIDFLINKLAEMRGEDLEDHGK